MLGLGPRSVLNQAVYERLRRSPSATRTSHFTASVLGATVLLQALDGEDDVLVDDLEVPDGRY